MLFYTRQNNGSQGNYKLKIVTLPHTHRHGPPLHSLLDKLSVVYPKEDTMVLAKSIPRAGAELNKALYQSAKCLHLLTFVQEDLRSEIVPAKAFFISTRTACKVEKCSVESWQSSTC